LLYWANNCSRIFLAELLRILHTNSPHAASCFLMLATEIMDQESRGSALDDAAISESFASNQFIIDMSTAVS
jgi:hypothetical protein